ncbi:hypothetical protein [Mycobacterium celatum]|uniref:hypothetical protein n=1 Tax=Mycobacterium celatum TaxID=28045 RepID=UPI000B290B70|nr:hypothetical protein [Mycobacterium celatum]
MNTEANTVREGAEIVDDSRGLAELAAISFDQLDAEEILAKAATAVSALTPCRVEATYRCVGGAPTNCPAAQPQRTDIESQLPKCRIDGRVALANAPALLTAHTVGSEDGRGVGVGRKSRPGRGFGASAR